MAPERFVLDTSALVALIEDEAGADRVEHVLELQTTLIPGIALVEVYYITLQERGEEEANLRHGLILDMKVEILRTLDDATMLTAARFKAGHQVSLADALVASWAFQHDATLLHKDPEFDALKGKVKLEALPYKGLRASRKHR